MEASTAEHLPHPLAPLPVPVLDELPSNSDFVCNYLVPGRPVILKNAFSHWRAAQSWSLPYLKQTAGHNVVHVRKNVHLEEYKVGKKYNIEQMTFAQCAWFETLKSGSIFH